MPVVLHVFTVGQVCESECLFFIIKNAYNQFFFATFVITIDFIHLVFTLFLRYTALLLHTIVFSRAK